MEIESSDPTVVVESSPAVVAVDSNATSEWSPLRRVLFRLTFVYLGLYCTGHVLAIFDQLAVAVLGWVQLAATHFWHAGDLGLLRWLGDGTSTWWDKVWRHVTPWVGRHVLQWKEPITNFTNGSGDTLFDWLTVGCQATIAVVVALVWSLLARNREGYPKLHTLLRACVRLTVLTAMFSYGAAKVIKSQFPSPPLDRLMQPFGEASPMGLLWTTLGFSDGYNWYMGAAEMLSGLLLIARRTTTLGGLVTAAVMSNVVAMNFCYDVPVKLYASHLCAMGAWLALPDLRRLFDALILNRPVPAAVLPRFFANRFLHGIVAVLWTFVCGWYGVTTLLSSHEMAKQYGDSAPKPTCYGIWEVTSFQLDPLPPSQDASAPALSTPLAGAPPISEAPWQQVVVGNSFRWAALKSDGTRERWFVQQDEEKRKLALSRRGDATWKAELTYEYPTPDTWTISGTFGGRNLKVDLRRGEVPQFPLMERGFHWINEFSYNY